MIIDLDTLMQAIESGDYIGFCTHCGAECLGVKPDAEDYECEVCGKHAVSGAEQLLLVHPQV